MFLKKLTLPRNKQEWATWFNKNKAMLGVLTGAILFLLYASREHSTNTETTQADTNSIKESPLPPSEKLTDPRALWAYEVKESVGRMDAKVEEKLKATHKQTEGQIDALKAEISKLMQMITATQKETSPTPIEPSVRVIDEPTKEATPQVKIIKSLGHLSNPHIKPKRKNPKEYVPSGAFVRAVLLTGVVAETGTDAASEPQPILLRLVDHSIFSKGIHNSQVKDAILIGSCHGQISSERAVCRLESVSLENQEGVIIEKPLEGWVIGEDGRPGIKGDVIDKASDVARMAILNGILGGIANFFQNQATSSVYPISPIAGQTNALKSMDALKAGGASGVGNALQKLADYAIKRAEQMNPVIMIGAGRQVDVVFRKGFNLKEEEEKAAHNSTPINANPNHVTLDSKVAKQLNQAGLKEAEKLQQLGGF